MLEEGVALAAPIDDTANRSSEGPRRAAPRVHRAEPRQVLARKHVTRCLEREPRARSHEPLAEALYDERNRQQSQGHEDLATEAAGRHEDESADALRACEEHRLRNSAAERVANYIRAVHTRHVEPTRHDARVPVQLVGRVRVVRQPVPWEVGYEHAPIACQLMSHLPPRAVTVLQSVQEHERRPAGRNAQLGPV